MRNQCGSVAGFASPEDMTHEWITHRLPTEADANHDGDVKVPAVIGAVPPHGWYQHHTLVVPGQPWWSHQAAERAEVAAPAPELTRKVVQIATPERSLLVALCNDSTMWALETAGPWHQLPAIPQPEA